MKTQNFKKIILLLPALAAGAAFTLSSCAPAEKPKAEAAAAKDSKAAEPVKTPQAAEPAKAAKDDKAKKAEAEKAAEANAAEQAKHKVIANLENPGFGVAALFDGNNDLFWEASGPAPYIISLEYPVPQTMIKYTMRTGAHPEQRMPTDWVLQGSNDNKEWKDIDKRAGIEWPKNDFKSFYISRPDKFKFYRWSITQTQTPGVIRIYEMGIMLRKNQN